ncbi:hypothetical protein OIU34_20250 [Pararhizobium sp. BT-229]|uniref:hypothetical protein n=1 Tax=Pararhizobium sp. BT-229 TaxID=2986923 RepID=UPI0021F7760B|nr:hypothetical protein [Pararhizobium sp. BT-229]MCV9964220.1 hypothetical protein [Pararhizobium sp. BT-229]
MDDTVQLPKTFEPERISVTRVVHGVAGSSLGKRELTDLVQVTWGRTTNTTIEIHINGVFVDDRSTYCDGGKIGSSVSSAMEEWQDMVEEYGAGRGDRFEISVVSWIKDLPTLGYARDDVFGQKCYFMLPQQGSAFFLGVPETGLDSMPREDLRTLGAVHHSRTKVTSSLWTKEENEAAVAVYLRRVEEETRTETDVFSYYG